MCIQDRSSGNAKSGRFGHFVEEVSYKHDGILAGPTSSSSIEGNKQNGDEGERELLRLSLL
jgi:hypothetical protein